MKRGKEEKVEEAEESFSMSNPVKAQNFEIHSLGFEKCNIKQC